MEINAFKENSQSSLAPFSMLEYSKSLTQKFSNCPLSKIQICIPLANLVSQFMCLVDIVICVHPLQLVVFFVFCSTVLYRVHQCTTFISSPVCWGACVKTTVHRSFCQLGTKASFVGLLNKLGLHVHSQNGTCSNAGDYLQVRSLQFRKGLSSDPTATLILYLQPPEL